MQSRLQHISRQRGCLLQRLESLVWRCTCLVTVRWSRSMHLAETSTDRRPSVRRPSCPGTRWSHGHSFNNQPSDRCGLARGNSMLSVHVWAAPCLAMKRTRRHSPTLDLLARVPRRHSVRLKILVVQSGPLRSGGDAPHLV